MTSEKEMLVTQVRIKNVLGLDEFAIEPGRINIISGRNGAGKSSTMKAIQNTLGGGSLAEIQTKDTEGNPIGDPEIVLHMSSDDGEYIVSKNAKSTKVKHQVGDSAAFEDVKAPQKFLSSLFDGKLSNPVSFMSDKTTDKERVHLLLEALELPFDADALWDSMAIDSASFPPVPAGMHPLSEIGMVRGNVFNERTGVNRDEKGKRASCEQTRRSVPAEIPTVEALDEKETALSDSKVKRAEFVKQSEHKCQESIQGIQFDFESFDGKTRGDMERTAEKMRSAAEQKIADMAKEVNAVIDEQRTASEAKKTTARELLATELKEIEGLNPEITALEKDIAVLKERAKDVVRITTLHDQADKFESQADELRERSEVLTAAIGALDKYKANMCQNLPIVGLDITDNVIKVNGIPWGQLNTAQQIDIAVQISCIRSEESALSIVWIDGAEALDADSFEMLRQNLENRGVQAFIGRVENHDLTVEK